MHLADLFVLKKPTAPKQQKRAFTIIKKPLHIKQFKTKSITHFNYILQYTLLLLKCKQ